MSITLFCLVKGNTTANAFEVNIEKDKSVSHLKKVIKAEQPQTFANVDAKDIKLWNVKIPDDQDDQLSNLSLQDQPELLATRDIGDYWTEKPLKKHIHVLVEPPASTATETVPWNDSLESYLCQLYARDDIVDIFWGRTFEGDDATWCVYVVTRNLFRRKKIEKIGGQVIHFIEEEEGFVNAEIPPQNPHDPLPTWKKVPKELQKSFDEALDNELGPLFRETHYNLVGMSTGYKRTQGKFTEIPAIILYVRQKGILRRGCVKFPDEILGYPTDVVEACIATPYGFGTSNCQSFQENVKLGSSIGIIEPHRTSGTLSAVVYDRNSKQIGILSCEHVCRFNNSRSGKGVMIHQPSHKDLDSLKESFVRMASENKSYIKISEEMCNKIEKDKQNSALACYVFGMRDNFPSEIHKKHFGIDAAFCIFNNNNRTLCSNKFSVPPEDFKKAKLSEDTCQNGFYLYEEFDDVDEINVFKVGKATGLTLGKLVPTYSSVSIDLRNESIEFARKQGEIPPYSNDVDKEVFIGYMKTPLVEEINEMHQQCYPTVWFDRQLIFAFKPGDFVPGECCEPRRKGSWYPSCGMDNRKFHLCYCFSLLCCF